jgi:double zinc ribbon protein
MSCPRCHADNPAGMKFCGQCAAPLASSCPSCGAANPPGHKFCGQCATPLAGAETRFAAPKSYTLKHLAERPTTIKPTNCRASLASVPAKTSTIRFGNGTPAASMKQMAATAASRWRTRNSRCG